MSRFASSDLEFNILSKGSPPQVHGLGSMSSGNRFQIWISARAPSLGSTSSGLRARDLRFQLLARAPRLVHELGSMSSDFRFQI